jgi:hypothetical protein
MSEVRLKEPPHVPRPTFRTSFRRADNIVGSSDPGNKIDLRSSVRFEIRLAPSTLSRCTAWNSWNTHRNKGSFRNRNPLSTEWRPLYSASSSSSVSSPLPGRTLVARM